MKHISALRKCETGVTLVETVVAMCISVPALVAFSASVSEAMRVARSGKAVASATEMLTQRIEAFRQTTSWSNVTTASGIGTIAASASPIAVNFPGVTETFTVQPYPSGTALVVTRSSGGSFTNNGTVLPTTTTCVRFTVAATWRAVGSASQARQISTVITKGGL